MQISQRNSKVIKNKPNDKSMNNKKNVSLFKNFKNEPFDVDSQLQNFLNSQFN